MRRVLLPLLVVALLLPATADARSVPPGWLGVSFGPEYVAAHARLSTELARMRRSGVESARFAAYWSRAQPYATMADVPATQRAHFEVVDGVPTDFRFLDRLVTAAAKCRLRLLPVVLGAPRWATSNAARPVWVPSDTAPYARFAATLAGRYGTRGTFWSEHPSLRRFPIRSWQIWNEVSNPWYWDGSWSSAYPRLLRAAYDAIKAADPAARVLESGLNTGARGRSWDALATLYRELDAQSLGRPFDAIAVHVYTKSVADAVQVVRRTRAVAARYGDATRPIRVTELAWPAARGRLRDASGKRREFFAATTDRGMAQRLAKGVPALARQRRALGISGVDWFQWASSYKGTHDAFRYSGLRKAAHRRFTDRPALKAYRAVARRLRR
jgi:hypothetical protein